VTEAPLAEMGPIDYVILEWPEGQMLTGDVMPRIVDLVDRGIVRILDIQFIAKDADGSVVALDFAQLADSAPGLSDFEGASSGLLSADDLTEAAAALEPGTAAAVLVWENSWAAPVAAALRRSGGELVASGRIPVQAILESLDATEAIH